MFCLPEDMCAPNLQYDFVASFVDFRRAHPVHDRVSEMIALIEEEKCFDLILPFQEIKVSRRPGLQCNYRTCRDRYASRRKVFDEQC